MTASYDVALATDKDWVRRLIGDVDTTAAQLQDEEIAAFLDAEPNKYYAAAAALGAMHASWTRKGAGVVEKQVGRLRLRRGDGQSAAAAVEARICELQARGSREMRPRPKVLRTL